jgi:hypothetical protein
MDNEKLLDEYESAVIRADHGLDTLPISADINDAVDRVVELRHELLRRMA